MHSLDKLYDSLAAGVEDSGAAVPRLVTRASGLRQHQEPLTPEHSNEEVREFFMRHPALETVAVTEAGRPIGLINRNIFMEQYARPFGRDVFGRKSAIAFMDKGPVVVDENTPIETLVRLSVEAGSRVLSDGFITTDGEGLYTGMGTGYALMRAMSDIEAEKTRQLLSSISYASLIQRSHQVESDRVLRHDLPDHGLLWEPRDVVGGDAYFFRQTPFGTLGCLFDCTGHGVPGAFMTLIVMSFLEQTVASAQGAVDPGKLLGQLNQYLKKVLQQHTNDPRGADAGGKASDDGLDMAMFLLAPDRASLRFASAKLSLMIARDGQEGIETVEGDKLGIGYFDTPDNATWTTREVLLGERVMAMIPTDGVIDQIGGPKRIAHGRRRLSQFLEERRGGNAADLCSSFRTAFGEWQGTQSRRDDVSLLVFITSTTSPVPVTAPAADAIAA